MGSINRNMKRLSIKEIGLDSIQVDSSIIVAVFSQEEIPCYEGERIFLTYKTSLENELIPLFRAIIENKQIRLHPDEYKDYHEFMSLKQDELFNNILKEAVLRLVEKSKLFELY